MSTGCSTINKENADSVESAFIGINYVISDLEDFIKWSRNYHKINAFQYSFLKDIVKELSLSKECLNYILNDIEEEMSK